MVQVVGVAQLVHVGHDLPPVLASDPHTGGGVKGRGMSRAIQVQGASDQRASKEHQQKPGVRVLCCLVGRPAPPVVQLPCQPYYKEYTSSPGIHILPIGARDVWAQRAKAHPGAAGIIDVVHGHEQHTVAVQGQVHPKVPLQRGAVLEDQ